MTLSTSEVCFRRDYKAELKSLLSDIKQRSGNLKDSILTGV
jgi:hypothetical protein